MRSRKRSLTPLIGHHLPIAALPKCIHNARHALYEMADDAPVYIYFLLCSDVLIYVGQTLDLNRRVRDHHAKGRRFNRVLYTLVGRIEADGAEAWYIQNLKPTENNRKSPGGRRRSLKRVSQEFKIISPSEDTDEACSLTNAVNDPWMQRVRWVRDMRADLCASIGGAA